ncbi:hypothetical protein N7491_008803 [Penicillium cf. griseofulvum]|nr:hypothetical protein N7491_008803 [Penicillium cf. griseofulvum]
MDLALHEREFMTLQMTNRPHLSLSTRNYGKRAPEAAFVTHFTLDRVYEALQTSEKCNHIWALFERIFLITRKSKKEEICSIRPGLYRVPSGKKSVMTLSSQF